jgi:phospholipase A1/A2
MKKISKTRVLAALLSGLAAVAGTMAHAGSQEALHECREIQDGPERLRCYDSVPGSTDTETTPVPGEPAGAQEKPALERRLEKERDLARRAFTIIPHRPNYILHTYSSEPNVGPFKETDPDADLQHQEIKFQLSLRVPFYNNMFGGNGDLWFGYTQLSFWQAYNWDRSAPVRETDYEPELGLTFHTDFSLFGIKHRLFSVGIAHQSNGRSEPLSRSWNRVWASFVLERGNLMVTLKPWYRIPESSVTDGNPEIEEYAGRGELHVAYTHRDRVLSFLLRNNLQASENRSGYELDWSLPFSKRIKGLVQYYNGYGESLTDYNVRTRRFGLGVLITDWL